MNSDKTTEWLLTMVCGPPKSSPDHSSVGATGGVYKGQGRNQGKLMTYPY